MERNSKSAEQQTTKVDLPGGMGASATHNAITLRPPPGTRFSIWGHDVQLQFQRGREREIIQWLKEWIDSYIVPEADKHERLMEAQAEQERQKYDENGNLKIDLIAQESNIDATKQG